MTGTRTPALHHPNVGMCCLIMTSAKPEPPSLHMQTVKSPAQMRRAADLSRLICASASVPCELPTRMLLLPALCCSCKRQRRVT